MCKIEFSVCDIIKSKENILNIFIKITYLKYSQNDATIIY